MTSIADTTAASMISLIESGVYPRDVVATIARGFLPLPPLELIPVLAYLAVSKDGELAEMAQTSLKEIPSRTVNEFASSETSAPQHLAWLLQASDDALVLEALIRNRQIEDEPVRQLALHAEGRVQEVIVINHARILRTPEILDALLENPRLTPDARRRVHEAREEFFVKRTRFDELEEPEEIDLPLDPIADLLDRAAVVEAEVVEVPSVTLSEEEVSDDRSARLWSRLHLMSVSEKVRLAYRGDRMVRMLLVRERNKLICSAVMRNPRMSEPEAEAIAGMRNVDDEVLRLLSQRRDWMGKYQILLALCRNPKAPLGVVLPLINRLILRDLKGLKDDRGVPQVVREMARKLFLTRSKKAG